MPRKRVSDLGAPVPGEKPHRIAVEVSESFERLVEKGAAGRGLRKKGPYLRLLAVEDLRHQGLLRSPKASLRESVEHLAVQHRMSLPDLLQALQAEIAPTDKEKSS